MTKDNDCALFIFFRDSIRALRNKSVIVERIEGASAGGTAKKKEEGTEIVRGVVCLCFRLHGFDYAIESSRTEPRAVV